MDKTQRSANHTGNDQLPGLPGGWGQNGILREPLRHPSMRDEKGCDHLRRLSGVGDLSNGGTIHSNNAEALENLKRLSKSDGIVWMKEPVGREKSKK